MLPNPPIIGYSKIMLKPIRSYVRREGRMTPKQRLALEKAWPLYGLSGTEGVLNLEQIFKRTNPKVLEIGFGMGQSLIAMAAAQAETDFIGIEVHRPGLGAAIVLITEKKLSNIRLVEADAAEFLAHSIEDNSFDRIQIFFPDPWPKQRHHKRRLIQAEFVNLVQTKLKPGGGLHLATDWQDYAEQMMEVLSTNPGLKNTVGTGQYLLERARPITKFEQRGLHLGHDIWDLLFIKAD